VSSRNKIRPSKRGSNGVPIVATSTDRHPPITLALRDASMHRLARLQLEAVELAAEQPLHVFERARTQASRKIHRDHRSMKHDTIPAKSTSALSRKVGSEKPTKILGVLAIALKSRSGSSRPHPYPPRAEKNRFDLGVGEVSLQLIRTLAIVASQNSRTRQYALRNFDPIAHRGKHVDAPLEMRPFDRGGGRDNGNCVAGLSALGLIGLRFTLSRPASYQKEHANARQMREWHHF